MDLSVIKVEEDDKKRIMSSDDKKNIRRSKRAHDLPADIIEATMELLSLADQIRLRCVCKSWMQLPLHHDRLVDKLPWLVTCARGRRYYESDGFVCKLFDPSNSNQPYASHKITGPSMNSDFPDHVATKDGWLIFLWEIGEDYTELFLFLFLFCPYTKEIITLANLIYKKYVEEFPKGRVVRFSSDDPNSQECVFFVFYYCRGCCEREVCISTYKRSDKGWITKVSKPPLACIMTAECYDGKFYCVDFHGSLAYYDVDHQLWYCVEGTESAHILNNAPGLPHSLVVSDGELLLAYYCHKEQSRLFRMCWSRREWVRVEKIENKAVFLGLAPWDSSIAVSELTGDAAFAANKVFYGTGFHEFGKTKRHSCKGTEFDCFVPEGEEYIEVMWIKPPQYLVKSYSNEMTLN